MTLTRHFHRTAVAFGCMVLGSFVRAQSGADEAWLRYQSLPAPSTAGLPHLIAVVGRGEVLRASANELAQALGQQAKSAGAAAALPDQDAFVLGTWQDLRPLFPKLGTRPSFSGDGFWLKTV